LRIAGEAEREADKAAYAETKDSLRTIAKSWRKLAREIERTELGLG
jgi:hypothetical protein